jgi:hypothetical protein
MPTLLQNVTKSLKQYWISTIVTFENDDFDIKNQFYLGIEMFEYI